MKKEFQLTIYDSLAEFVIDAAQALLKKKGYHQQMHHQDADGLNIYQYVHGKTNHIISFHEKDRPGDYREFNLQSETVDLAGSMEEIFADAYNLIGEKLVQPLQDKQLKKIVSRAIKTRK